MKISYQSWKNSSGNCLSDAKCLHDTLEFIEVVLISRRDFSSQLLLERQDKHMHRMPIHMHQNLGQQLSPWAEKNFMHHLVTPSFSIRWDQHLLDYQRAATV